MFLSTVILVLQEILEAALLISVLLVLSRLLTRSSNEHLVISNRWLPFAALFGLAGAWLYAAMMPVVSEWFDYVGLEIINGTIQIIILAILCLFCFMFSNSNRITRISLLASLAPVLMCVMVALGITREVSEIILYMNGVMATPVNVSPAILGSVIAAGIGVSSGIVLYFLILSLSVTWSYRICMLLLALFAGNLASQATLLLTQADWLPYTRELWNSSGFIPEYSVTGQLLYALIGYEANPSLLQVVVYFCSALLIVFSPLFRLAWTRSDIVQGYSSRAWSGKK
jgi:high-affinity iron transporter